MRHRHHHSRPAWMACSGRAAATLVSTLVIGMALPGSLRAQWVKGIVLDEFTHGPVRGADVTLVADGRKVVARTVTGDDGRFTMSIPKFGGYHLAVDGLGYAPFDTKIFFADSVQQVSAQVNLAPEAIKLAGLEVTTEATERKLRLGGYYKRKKANVGYFVTEQDLKDKVINRLTDALYGIPGFTVRRIPGVANGGSDVGWDVVTNSGETKYFVGGRCFPSVAIDGTIVRHGGRESGALARAGAGGGNAHDVEVGDWWQLVDVHDVVAMEIYPRTVGAPVQMQGQESPCGVIMIWTKDR